MVERDLEQRRRLNMEIVIKLEDIKKNNKRMCLNPLRVFGKCDECEIIKRYYTDQTRTQPKGIKPCESIILSKSRKILLKKKAIIKEQIKELEIKLKNLR